MNVNDFMAKHGITDADLDRMAAPYEDGSFEPEPDGKVFSGSHLDAVGTRRVTVVYDAKDTQRVAMIARSKGVKPSSVYRDALDGKKEKKPLRAEWLVHELTDAGEEV